MGNGGDHVGDPSSRIFAERKWVGVEEGVELLCDVGSGEIEVFVAEELFLHLGQLLLGVIDFSEDEGDLVRDEGDVVGMVRNWRRSESVEGEEIGEEQREEHEDVDESSRAARRASKSNTPFSCSQRNRTHCYTDYLLSQLHNRPLGTLA